MRQAGLSLSERALSHQYFIIAITSIVIAILLYVLSEKLDQEFAHAENRQFEFRLAELRAAVLLQEAALVAKDQMALAERFEGANPMEWMEDDTSHYLGEMSLETVEGQAGNWVYDPGRKVIAYKVKTQGFMSGKIKSKPKWLQFKVVALLSKEQGTKVSKGLSLKAVDEIGNPRNVTPLNRE